LELVPL